MVDSGRELHDPVSEPDSLRALAGGGEEDLRGRGVRILLQEVMLDLPDAVEAGTLRHHYLLQRVLQQAPLGVLAPGPRKLVLVEEAEPHSGVEHTGRPLTLGRVNSVTTLNGAAAKERQPYRLTLAVLLVGALA